jgi:hypothetical protein
MLRERPARDQRSNGHRLRFGTKRRRAQSPAAGTTISPKDSGIAFECRRAVIATTIASRWSWSVRFGSEERPSAVNPFRVQADRRCSPFLAQPSSPKTRWGRPRSSEFRPPRVRRRAEARGRCIGSGRWPQRPAHQVSNGCRGSPSRSLARMAATSHLPATATWAVYPDGKRLDVVDDSHDLSALQPSTQNEKLAAVDHGYVQSLPLAANIGPSTS